MQKAVHFAASVQLNAALLVLNVDIETLFSRFFCEGFLQVHYEFLNVFALVPLFSLQNYFFELL